MAKNFVDVGRSVDHQRLVSLLPNFCLDLGLSQNLIVVAVDITDHWGSIRPDDDPHEFEQR
jgi:hypothetical protein